MNKINQDSFITQMNYQGKDSQHLFGVYDGHGVNGQLVSNYISSNLPTFFGYHVRSGISVEEA
jgi:serine/threonine protein phosphatase PrpC